MNTDIVQIIASMLFVIAYGSVFTWVIIFNYKGKRIFKAISKYLNANNEVSDQAIQHFFDFSIILYNKYTEKNDPDRKNTKSLLSMLEEMLYFSQTRSQKNAINEIWN